jgi:hypothetical protein
MRAHRSMAGLALAWLLADDRVAQIVIGPGRPEHLAPVTEALQHPVTGQERAMINEAVVGLAPRDEAPRDTQPTPVTGHSGRRAAGAATAPLVCWRHRSTR